MHIQGIFPRYWRPFHHCNHSQHHRLHPDPVQDRYSSHHLRRIFIFHPWRYPKTHPATLPPSLSPSPRPSTMTIRPHVLNPVLAKLSIWGPVELWCAIGDVQKLICVLLGWVTVVTHNVLNILINFLPSGLSKRRITIPQFQTLVRYMRSCPHYSSPNGWLLLQVILVYNLDIP